jgi:hypothetical protein
MLQFFQEGIHLAHLQMYYLAHNAPFKVVEELIAVHRTAHEKSEYDIFGWLIYAHCSFDLPRFAFRVLADSVPKNVKTSKQGGDRRGFTPPLFLTHLDVESLHLADERGDGVRRVNVILGNLGTQGLQVAVEGAVVEWLQFDPSGL